MELSNKTLNQTHSIQGHFQWNFLAWFGAIVGSTSWMLVVAGYLLAWREEVVAAIPIAIFVLVNVLAVGLWLRRSFLSPFDALMTVMAALAIVIPVTWFSVMHFASPQVLAAMQWPNSIYSKAVVILIVPSVMLRFWIVERQARSNKPMRRDVSTDV